MTHFKTYKLNFKSKFLKLHFKAWIFKISLAIIALGIINFNVNADTNRITRPKVKFSVRQTSSLILKTIENHVGDVPDYMKPVFITYLCKIVNKKINEYILTNQTQRGIYEMTQILRNENLCKAPGGALKIAAAGIIAVRLSVLPEKILIPKYIISLSLAEMRLTFLRCLHCLNVKLPFEF